MEHIIKVTDTINQTLKEIEDKRYGEEVYSVEWFRLTEEIGILRRVGDHLRAKAKVAAEYSKKIEELDKHQENCPRCSFIPTCAEDERDTDCPISDEINYELDVLRKQIEKGDL